MEDWQVLSPGWNISYYHFTYPKCSNNRDNFTRLFHQHTVGVNSKCCSYCPLYHSLCNRIIFFWGLYYWTRQIWGIWKLRPAYSPETPNLGENRWCFVPCDLEIWWMTLENNRAPHLCCFKLCATFHSHRWIQTVVAVRKRPIWVKFNNF